MFEDRQLTENFSLHSLIRTDRVEFMQEQEAVTPEQIGKLTEVAKLGELIRADIAAPMIVHSGYRCRGLNNFVGSTDRSQHLLCEAMDWTPAGIELEKAFRQIWKSIKDGKYRVGQLIFETANRPYGVVSWIHVSLGAPWRDAAKCNEILRMQHGSYEMLEHVADPA